MNQARLVFLLMMQVLCANCVVACNAAADGEKSSVKSEKEQPVANDWIHPDEVAYQSLGRRLSDVLLNSKTVKVYSLTPKEKTNPDDYVVEGVFVRDEDLGTLNKDQMTVLRYNLISNGANYHNDSSLVVMSPYYPVIEFEFVKKKEVAHVLISLSDYSWTVKYDDKIQFNYNYAGGTFVKRFCDYFLNKRNQKQ